MKGYRGLLMVVAFLVWTLGETWIVTRATSPTAEILNALGIMFTGVGGAVVGGMFARGYKAGKVPE